MGKGEWEMGNGEWGKRNSQASGAKATESLCSSPFPISHSPFPFYLFPVLSGLAVQSKLWRRRMGVGAFMDALAVEAARSRGLSA